MKFHASGKLLLFGEYLVLHGGKGLAFPLHAGQKMTVEKTGTPGISWHSEVLSEPWLQMRFSEGLDILESNHPQAAARVEALFRIIRMHVPHIPLSGLRIQTAADFPLEWGFGSSSTLISLLSQWSGVNPYLLLEKSFGGSGYDVAAATAMGPFVYQNKEVESVSLSPSITSRMLFVYTGTKQNSSSEVRKFKQIKDVRTQAQRMNEIVDAVVACEHPDTLDMLVEESEALLAPLLDAMPIKRRLFPRYPYGIKSLGAWGGDFFMATFRDESAARNYFKNKGYNVQFTYDQIRKKNELSTS